MTFKTFLFKTMKSNIQKYSLFLLSTIFSMTIYFVFTNLCYTKGFKENTNSQIQTLMLIALAITILFSVFIISYVHWYMMKERSKSFSVLLSYGMLHKDLRKLIIRETIFIYIISLGIAFLTGSIFSRLFYMASTRLLSINNISYQLNPKSFLVTAIVFAAIFAGVLLIAIIRFSGKDLIELSKVKSNVELKKKGNAILGWVGFVLMTGSIFAVYLHNLHTMENVSAWILVNAVICFAGIYLFISHFSRLLYSRAKKNSKKYFRHILEISEFAISYRQNVKTLFVLTLLSFGIILFTSVTYTLNHEASRMTNTENPNDLFFQILEAVPIINEKETEELLSKSDDKVVKHMTLPFIYMNAPDIILQNGRNRKIVPVVDEREFNDCFNTNYHVNPGETIQIIFESNIDNDMHYLGKNVGLIYEAGNIHLKTSRIIYKKVLNRYTFPQPVLLLTSDQDFEGILAKANVKERGTLFLYNFRDWKESRKICNDFKEEYYDRYHDFSEKNTELNNELFERYGYSHNSVGVKIDYYELTKMQGSFSLFIMGFISILFLFCILVTYCFKVFMGADDDLERFHKLNGIGFLSGEQNQLIKLRLRLIMYVPSLIGILLGIGWIYSLNFKRMLEFELSNTTLLFNALCTGGIYLIITILYYKILKSSYQRRLTV